MLSVHSDLCRASGDHFPSSTLLLSLRPFVPSTNASSILSLAKRSARRPSLGPLVIVESPFGERRNSSSSTYRRDLSQNSVIVGLRRETRTQGDRSPRCIVNFVTAKYSSLTCTPLHNVPKITRYSPVEYVITPSRLIIIHCVLFVTIDARFSRRVPPTQRRLSTGESGPA